MSRRSPFYAQRPKRSDQAGSGNKFLKKNAHFPAGAVHAFRVPLDACSKGMILYFDGFNRSVRSPGGYGYSFSGDVDGLVVEAVDQECGPCAVPDQAAPFCADPVADVAAGRRLLHMIDGIAGDQRQVLPDCPSACHAEHLHAPADSQYRFSGGQYFFHQTDLEKVYSNACLSISILRFLPKEQGRDISASAEEKAGTKGNVLIQKGIAPDQGENQRKSSGIPDRLDIGIGDKLTVVHKTAYNNADNWLHNFLLLPGIY